KRFQEAWTTYEALPRTQEQDSVCREFVPAWETWQAANGQFLMMMREIESSGIIDTAEFKFQIRGFMYDHLRLVSDVQDLLMRGRSFDGGDNHQACNFGRWMAGMTIENPTIRQTLQE